MVNCLEYFKKPVLLSTLICIVIFYSGIFKIPVNKSFINLNNINSITELEGKILTSPAKISNQKYYSCNLQLLSTKSESNIKSSAKGQILVYIPANLVEAFYPGKLYSISGYGEKIIFETGGNYCFKGKFSNNCFYVEKCIHAIWNINFFSKLDYFRALCRLQFKRLMYSWGEGGGLLLALLCGAKEYTNKNVSDSFKNAGLSHILALSGMHLSMFSSIALFLGNKTGRKKISFIIRIIALFCFVWFAGLSPSLLRAYICAMLTILASMSGSNKPDMILILCFSFLLQSSISPSDIKNIGFILSYSALAGILIFNKCFYLFYNKIFPKQISASLAASTSAQIFTIPISLKLFGSFSPIGIIATTIISPLITIFIYLGLLSIVLCLTIPVLSVYSAIIINFLYNIIKYLVVLFSKAPIWSLN